MPAIGWGEGVATAPAAVGCKLFSSVATAAVAISTTPVHSFLDRESWSARPYFLFLFGGLRLGLASAAADAFVAKTLAALSSSLSKETSMFCVSLCAHASA